MRFPLSFAAALFLLPHSLHAEPGRLRHEGTIRVGVLSEAEKPAANTSQGLYIQILSEAGMDAHAVSAQMVKDGALDKLDIFIIGGGSGSKFNTSLGPDGGAKVRAFVQAGGGALASCAGGYSFVNGPTEVLRYISIAHANCIDFENGRWARGKGDMVIAPVGEGFPQLRVFYMNGPLWKIEETFGPDRTVALARYVTEVKKEGTPGGTMAGTPAILGGTCGDGRYVLFSAHPEFYKKYGNQPMVADAARWVVRGKLAADETIDYATVFPSMLARNEAAPAQR
ncbi:MAG: hypothetical protein QM755_22340 [Luteolibacter sp.]